jgi:hypothetical protein
MLQCAKLQLVRIITNHAIYGITGNIAFIVLIISLVNWTKITTNYIIYYMKYYEHNLTISKTLYYYQKVDEINNFLYVTCV